MASEGADASDDAARSQHLECLMRIRTNVIIAQRRNGTLPGCGTVDIGGGVK
jgi:hypothetical protein